MGDPVSWLVIEAGWEVVDANADRVGEVKEVVGDPGADIFSGLAVSPGLLRQTLHVPSESVGLIEQGRVHLTISSGDFDRLDEHQDSPPSEQFLAP